MPFKDPLKRRIYAREYYHQHIEKFTDKRANHKYDPRKKHDQHLRRRYGITLVEYEALFEKQGGKCAICKLNRSKRRLAVDHSHLTGKVRALLCEMCNGRLGWYEQYHKEIGNYLEAYE